MSDQVIYRIASVPAFRNLSDASKFLITSALLQYSDSFTTAELRRFLKASGYTESTLRSVKQFYQFVLLMNVAYTGPEVNYE